MSQRDYLAHIMALSDQLLSISSELRATMLKHNREEMAKLARDAFAVVSCSGSAAQNHDCVVEDVVVVDSED